MLQSFWSLKGRSGLESIQKNGQRESKIQTSSIYWIRVRKESKTI